MARILILILFLSLVACQHEADEGSSAEPAPTAATEAAPIVRITEHAGGDDLVTAGLGLEGLMGPAPAPADPSSPTAEELRRLAFHSTWRGLAALNPAGGVGGLIESLPKVEGQERMAFRRLPGRNSPARVLLQIPAGFDPASACLLLAPASGSRGVYGAVPLVAPWALPKGCAVAYTDKGAGSDVHDFDSGTGVGLDGRRVDPGIAETGLRAPTFEGEVPAGTVAIPHAHSGDHSEKDWGLYVLDAGRFALEQLREVYGPALDEDALMVIAAGLSNGGGAVLRAAEQDEAGFIDGVFSMMPNVSVPGVPHLYELGTLAALYQPCMLGDLEATMEMVLGNPLLAAAGQQRCTSLSIAGLLEASEPAEARARLIEAGFDEHALGLAATNVALDLWRTVAVTYSSAYLGRGPLDMPCGYGFDASSATPEQVRTWWSIFSGIAPGAGIELVDGQAEGRDPALAGLRCLYELNDRSTEYGETLYQAIEATRATARPRPDVPVLLVHGREDGLIPAGLTSRPYLEQARANGARIAYWEVARAQHFDALLAVPTLAGRLVPMLPYGWAGLDHLLAVLEGERELGEDRRIEPDPPAAGEALAREDLGL
ncbi:3-hydroxybutyrate oligomer hydrolase family protein [Wenzhouxiangella marina]|uniref:Hydrogenase n=1 Tax=Wenzhouxiangella marina TaxID=1579979 RepID=A0A0K0XYB6_9GAMM|nr:3-hydroxybutyrate oligomer hydrolase family protein [Wenzhouxiangella marina]AKS42684.1 hydrogenase [Wenzhouxiangella marina]MBB6088627.1 hydroxybutyrate-dimer hydrolase [Wenzhouxiangella marina]